MTGRMTGDLAGEIGQDAERCKAKRRTSDRPVVGCQRVRGHSGAHSNQTGDTWYFCEDEA